MVFRPGLTARTIDQSDRHSVDQSGRRADRPDRRVGGPVLASIGRPDMATGGLADGPALVAARQSRALAGSHGVAAGSFACCPDPGRDWGVLADAPARDAG